MMYLNPPYKKKKRIQVKTINSLLTALGKVKNKEYLKIGELSFLTGEKVKRQTLYEIIEKGFIPTYNDGESSTIYINKKEFERMLVELRFE